MFTILLHSSKTMRQPPSQSMSYQMPALLDNAIELARYIKTVSAPELAAVMKLSPAMAEKTASLMRDWSSEPSLQQPAIDAFLGDIYSGLQASSFTLADREYANDHLFILSGLYGILRALDGIMPYRFEMGYQLRDTPYSNLYTFWSSRLAAQLPKNQTIINLSAVEYTKAILPHTNEVRVITPKFLTRNKQTGQAIFVTVHAKIARGCFARWLITRRIQDSNQLLQFHDLGYLYDAQASTPEVPVFVCNDFQGIGLSVRLT